MSLPGLVLAFQVLENETFEALFQHSLDHIAELLLFRDVLDLGESYLEKINHNTCVSKPRASSHVFHNHMLNYNTHMVADFDHVLLQQRSPLFHGLVHQTLAVVVDAVEYEQAGRRVLETGGLVDTCKKIQLYLVVLD